VLLLLARHGEADGDGDDAALTGPGRRQAALLGARLAGHDLAAVRHSPLTRAAQTAALVGAHLPRVPVVADELLGDYVPFVPDPPPSPWATFFDGVFAEERDAGAAQAAAAIERYARAAGDSAELIVTHSFLIAWFVRHALEAPPARWMGLNAANTALTVIRYRPRRPPALVTFNDLSHLPADLQWTGFPPELRP
jgi:probable phosphoglycerate mutase